MGRATRRRCRKLRDEFGIPVVAIATLDDLMGFIAGRPELARQAAAVDAYREQYGVRTGARQRAGQWRWNG